MAQFSFKGWKFSKWFEGNWSTIKEGIKWGIPLLTIWFATEGFWLTAFGTILGKFILDSLHYWVKE